MLLPWTQRFFCEDRHYNVHCFATKTEAEVFLEKFGEEWFDPS